MVFFCDLAWNGFTRFNRQLIIWKIQFPTKKIIVEPWRWVAQQGDNSDHSDSIDKKYVQSCVMKKIIYERICVEQNSMTKKIYDEKYVWYLFVSLEEEISSQKSFFIKKNKLVIKKVVKKNHLKKKKKKFWIKKVLLKTFIVILRLILPCKRDCQPIFWKKQGIY